MPEAVAKARLQSRLKSVLIHSLAVACVVLLYLSIDSPAWVLILGGSLISPTYLFLALRESRREPLWFTPLSFYFYWYTVSFGLSAIHMGITVLSEDFVPLSIKEVPARDLATGYIIALVGSLALHIGMQISRPRRQDNPALAGAKQQKFLIVIGILWALGILIQLRPNWVSSFGALGNPLHWMALASVSSFALTGVAKLKFSSPVFFGIILIGTVGLFFVSLGSNSKAFIMFSFLPLLWLMIVDKPLRKWIPLAGITLAVFYFTIVAPVIMSSRNEQLLEGESLSDRTIRTLQSGNYKVQNTDDEGQIAAFLSRQFDSTPIGFLVGEVREYGLQMGDTMDYITYAFVPRLIWPDKPNVSRGAWFTAYLGFSSSEEESTTSTGITATGELYWNFGVTGVIAGMFFLGICIGGLWRMAGTDPRNKPVHMILYCMIMLTMPDMPEAVTVFVSIVINFLIFQTLFFLFGKRERKQRKDRVAIASTTAS